MALFILGLLIGTVGGMIMMAMFMTGKTRESSFDKHITMHRQSNNAAPGTGQDSTGKR